MHRKPTKQLNTTRARSRPETVRSAAPRPPGRDDKRSRNNSGAAGRKADPERLQKMLSRAGLASRREVEGWIRAGRITVNGAPAILGVRVVPSDQVRLDGRLIRQRAAGAARVFLCHRSPGESLRAPLDSSERAAGQEAGLPAETRRAALLERLPRRAGRRFIPVSPMPRADGGLELITSDGELASKLQRCVRGLACEFSVRVHGELGARALEAILLGNLDSGAKLDVVRCDPSGGEGSNRWYAFVAQGASGKEVRQLFERQGVLVSRVLRTRLGPLALDRHLARGQFRELWAEELQALTAATQAGTLPAQ